jgi:Tol biopolymer transport system component
VITASAGVAFFQWRSYRTEPQMVNHRVVDERAVDESGAIFSSAAALSPGQMVYESMADDRFVLRAAGPSGSRIFEFDGHAFHPSVPLAGEPVYFELLAGGRSQISRYRDSSRTLELIPDAEGIEPAISADGTKLAFVSSGSLVLLENGVRSLLAGGKGALEVSGPTFFRDGRRIVFTEGRPGKRTIRSLAISGGVQQTLIEGGDCFEPAVSPNGSFLAFSCSGGGGTQVWLLDLKSRIRRQLTHGSCNNTFPAWDPDSGSVVFASDCNRGVELPALYRAVIGQ